MASFVDDVSSMTDSSSDMEHELYKTETSESSSDADSCVEEWKSNKNNNSNSNVSRKTFWKKTDELVRYIHSYFMFYINSHANLRL